MPSWLAVILSIGGLGFALLSIYRIGRADQKFSDAQTSVEKKDDMLQAAANRPTDDELAERLRDGKF